MIRLYPGLAFSSEGLSLRFSFGLSPLPRGGVGSFLGLWQAPVAGLVAVVYCILDRDKTDQVFL